MSLTECERHFDGLVKASLEAAAEDPQRVEALLLEALQCAETSSMNVLIARAHTQLGMFYTGSKRLDAAHDQLMAAYAIACAANLESELSTLNGALGVLYWTLGDTERAEQFFYVSFTTDVQLEQDAALAQSYEFLSTLHSNSRLHAQARAYLRAALDIWLELHALDAQIRVQINLATKRQQSGSASMAEQGYLQTEVLCIIHDRTADLAFINLLLGELYTNAAKWSEAKSRLSCATEIYDRLRDHHGSASARLALGHLEYKRGQWPAAESHLRAALEFAAAGNDDALASAGQGGLGLLFNALGRIEEALMHFGRALTVARTIGNVKDEARTYSDMAIAYANQGNWKAAEEHNRKALALRSSFPEDLATSCRNLGGLLLKVGRSDEAQHYLEESLRLYTIVGDELNVVVATLNLGRVHFQMKNLDGAARYAKSGAARAVKFGEPKQVIDSLLLLAAVATAQGGSEEALDALRRAAGHARSAGNQEWEAACLRTQGIAYLKEENWEGAAEALQAALFTARATQKPDVIIPALASLAQLLALRGDYSASQVHHRLAVQMGEDAGQPQKVAELNSFRAYYLWQISKRNIDLQAQRPTEILGLVIPAMIHFDEHRTKFYSTQQRLSWASTWNGASLLALEIADSIKDAQLISEIVETQINATAYESTLEPNGDTSALPPEPGVPPAHPSHKPPIEPVKSFIVNGGLRLIAGSRLPVARAPLLRMPNNGTRVALGAYRAEPSDSITVSIPTW
jgi:tetratricopeptide (TPR) repeat protein